MTLRVTVKKAEIQNENTASRRPKYLFEHLFIVPENGDLILVSIKCYDSIALMHGELRMRDASGAFVSFPMIEGETLELEGEMEIIPQCDCMVIPATQICWTSCGRIGTWAVIKNVKKL